MAAFIPWVATVALLVAATSVSTASPAVKPPPPTLRVLTFNILHDSVRTLAPPWRSRRPFVAATIRSSHADVACLQEVSPRQLADLGNDLPEYQFFPGIPSGAMSLPAWGAPFRGIARYLLGDFFEKGEQCPILVKREALAVCLYQGSFWLSRPGRDTTSGSSPTPHVVNWIRIRFPSGLTVEVYNTHAGLVRGAAASGHLRAVLDRRWNGAMQILAGDLNAMPNGSLLRSLTSATPMGPPGFQDAWAAARSKAGGGATYHWGLGLHGPRLDYVLIRPPCLVPSAHLSAKRVAKTLPSDHFAVVVDIRAEALR